MPLKTLDRRLGTEVPDVQYLRHLTIVTVPTKAAAVYQLLK